MGKATEIVAKMGEVFHQLNNDLSLIMGQVELCIRATGQGAHEKLPQRLEALQRAAARMAEHVRQGQTAARKARNTSKNPPKTTKVV